MPIINNMLPAVISKKRSSSKLSVDISSSPYFQPFTRSSNTKSRTVVLKKSSPSAGKFSFNDGSNENPKLQDFKRLSLDQSTDFKCRYAAKPEELEKLLYERLKNFSIGDSEYCSEMEIFDSIFDEIVNLMKPFEKLLNLIRKKMKKECYKYAKEDFNEKVDRLEKDKKSLVAKINSLSDINAKLTEDVRVMEDKIVEFERILKQNPSFLITYQNIVNQMLQQCEEIEELKRENRKLKKVEECFMKISKDLHDCSMYDIPIIEETYPIY